MATDCLLVVHPQIVEVRHDNPKIDNLITNYLSYDTPNARHIRRVKLQQAKEILKELKDKDDVSARVMKREAQRDLDYWNRWSGKTCSYRHREFPIGFLWRVGMYLRVKRFSVTVDDRRSIPYTLPIDKQPRFLGVLRPYQQKVLKRMLSRQRGIVDVGTGGGKTVIALALLEHRPHHTFVIVPTIPLVDEWLYKTKEYIRFNDGERHVGFAHGKMTDLRIINIGNIQALHNALFRKTKNKKTLERYEMIEKAYLNSDTLYVDECHRAAATIYKKVILRSNAYYRYGFTATTDIRHDAADLEYYGLLGEKIAYISASELIEGGHISPARVIFHRWGFRYFVPPVKFYGENQVEDMGIVFNHLRNNLIVKDAWEAWVLKNRTTIIMVRRLDHGSLLLDLIRRKHEQSPLSFQKECVVEWVHGEQENRKKIIDDFREGKINILLTQHQLLAEGVDIPLISCVVMAAGGKSAIKTIQSLGRGIRLAEGKSDLLIHDYADEGRFIEKHAEQRMKTYLTESAFKVDVRDTALEPMFNYLTQEDV